MKRIGIILLLLAFTLAPYAQKKTASKKPAAKKTAVTQTKKSGKSGKSSKSGKSATPQPTVKSLQNQRQQIQKEIQKQETLLRNNEKDVKKRLQNLMVLNTEIEGKRRTIDTIRKDISHLDVEIEMLMTQLEELQDELNEQGKLCQVDALYAPQPFRTESDDVHLQCRQPHTDVPPHALYA